MFCCCCSWFRFDLLFALFDAPLDPVAGFGWVPAAFCGFFFLMFLVFGSLLSSVWARRKRGLEEPISDY